MLKTVFAKITQASKNFSDLSPVRKVFFCLAAIAVYLVGVLIFSEKPWAQPVVEGQLKIRDYVRIWFWWAAAINLCILAGLALTVKWWTRAAKSNPGPLFPKSTTIWFWPLLLSAVVFLFLAASPRLGQSLWHDEANRVKNTLVGEYREKDGGYTFRTATWRDTLFYYRLPNHTLQSILSRASHDIWLSITRPQGYPLSETALRFPLLIVGGLGLVTMALLLRSIGQPMAGVAVAWLLALHPWYVRYASEARGYILVMALLPFALHVLLRAVETGKLRWWAAYGFAQVAMVYSYATAAYILIVLNALFPLALLFSRKKGLDRPVILTRWFISSLVAGAVFLQLFLPCVPQFLEYLSSGKGMGGGNQLNSGWVANFLAHMLVGTPWTITGLLDSPYLELLEWASSHPAVFAGIAVGVSGLIALGVRWCVASGAFATLMASAFVLPAILCFADTKARESFLFEWYLIFLLPGVVALVVLGARDLAQAPASAAAKSILAVAFVGFIPLYGIWTHRERSELASNSLQPYREAVLSTRPTLDPVHPDQENILTVAFHAGPLIYDPRLKKLNSVAEMQSVIQRADTDGKELYINLAYLGATKHEQPGNYQLVSESGLFLKHAFFRGFNPTLSTEVFRYIPGSAKDFDFAPYQALENPPKN